ncbi:uracil-DNA glycosylase [Gluconacetobacter tumulisoli]|uniref:Type-4 uracil-DNA glycosylase n=2 Tax=Gluconacetobacter tumulisoli TaxID=1286189 RepID=A0A7W4K405_9PROT|nr:uracil-DNA glycosylase [Gluconacetobacter tumulisoli]
MDALALLRLYVDWGADAALDDDPTDRLAAPPPSARAVPPTAPSPLASAPHDPALRPPVRQDSPSPSPPARRPSGPEDGLTLIDRAVLRARQVAEAASSIADLQTALAAFDGCALRETATHTIAPAGRADAGLMLIGEPPDAAEDRGGTPFAGPTGQMLDRMLASIGLRREDLLLAPVIPWRPPGARPPSAAELRICEPFLHRLIVLAAPRRVILMGNMPARLLTGEQGGIARLRGRWRDIAIPGLSRPLPALPMRHPSQLGASPTARRDAWKDLLLLRATLDADKDT